MKIYLVRHGETDANKRYYARTKSKFTVKRNRYRQATNLKNKLVSVPFTVCFTSPLIRAWSTAMIIVGDRVEIKEDDRLIER